MQNIAQLFYDFFVIFDRNSLFHALLRHNYATHGSILLILVYMDRGDQYPSTYNKLSF